MTHREHTLEQCSVGVVAQATYFAGRSHIDTQHRVGLLQTIERELTGLDANIIQVEEVLVGFLYRQTKHHLGGKFDEIDFEHLADKRERT